MPQMPESTATPSTVEFTALSAILQDVDAACSQLPPEEQQRYEEAQQSVVDARRSAETHEGLMQVC